MDPFPGPGFQTPPDSPGGQALAHCLRPSDEAMLSLGDEQQRLENVHNK
jgi:hypothetical protein